MALRLLISSGSLFSSIRKQADTWQGGVEFATRVSLKQLYSHSSTLGLPSPGAAPICDLSLGPSPGASVTPEKQMKGSANQLCRVPQVTQCQRDSKAALQVCWGVPLTVGRKESTEPMLGAHSLTAQSRMRPSVCGKAGSEILSAVFLPVDQANATGIDFS